MIGPGLGAAPADPMMAGAMPPAMMDPLAPPPAPGPMPPKSDQIGFRGGLPVDLDRVMGNGQTVREALGAAIHKALEREIENHRPRIEAVQRWNKLYSGVREEKNYPYPGANNIAIPFSMYQTDATTVRVMDAIWGQKKIFIVTGRKQPFIDMARDLEDSLDWWQKDIVRLKKKLFSPILQSMKVGTSFVKLEYVDRQRTACRYARPEEVQQGKPGVFQFENGEYGIKDVMTNYSGPDIFAISREDAVWTSTARTIQEARLFAYRSYREKPEVEADERTGRYLEGTVEKLGKCDDIDATKIARAKDAKLEVKTGESNQYEVWELWYKFDVDEDGEEDDLVISWHRNSKTIMSSLYNQVFSGFRPIVPIVFNPMEFSIEGKGIVEILEGIQQAIDFYHNARLDRLDRINNPVTVVQQGVELDDFVNAPGTKWLTQGVPGEVVYELVGSGSMFPPSVQEEQILQSYGEKAAGASAAVMGQSVSERPVARETLALLQEANKKFKFGIDNLRDCIGEIGMMALELFAQFQPKYTYFVNQGATLQSQDITFPLDYLRDGCNVELTASSEMLNTEARQQVGLTAYQLLSDYYTKTSGMVAAIVSPGPSLAFKKYLMTVMAIGGDLLRGIMEDLGLRNSEELVPEWEKDPDMMREAIQTTVAAATAPPPNAPPPEGEQGGGGAPPPEGTQQ